MQHCSNKHLQYYHGCNEADSRLGRGLGGDLRTEAPRPTFDDLLSQMVEQEKKRRFIEEMDRIEAEGDFVELDFDVPDTA